MDSIAIISLLFWMAAPVCAAPVPATNLYVPSGYDDTDEVIVVVEGYLDSRCQNIRDTRIVEKGKKFEIHARAESSDTQCDAIPVPYVLEVKLNPNGPMAAGDYEVVVPTTKTPLKEPLRIGSATPDQPLAPVDHAEVGMLSQGKMRALIEGSFPNTCHVLDHLDISSQNGKTYELYPVAKMLSVAADGSPCEQKERRYTAYQDFEEPDPGRYLLNVRTDGQSVNHIFTNVW